MELPLKLGIQMYSVRDYMAQDPVKTIQEVGKLGYRQLEFANFDVTKDLGVGFGVPVEELRPMLQDMGVSVVGLHFRAGQDSSYSTVDFGKLFQAQRVLGTQYMVLPSAYFESNDDIKRKAETYNDLGKLCHEAGFDFCYHNHVEIGQRFDGQLALDVLAEYTDPEFVKFEIDTYWAQRGGLDPKEVLKKLGKRVVLIHQKDMPETMPCPTNVFAVEDPAKPLNQEAFMRYIVDGAFVEIGTGTMDIQGIVDCANEYTSAQHMILEQDRTDMDQLQSLAVSMENFKKLKGIAY